MQVLSGEMGNWGNDEFFIRHIDFFVCLWDLQMETLPAPMSAI